MFNGEGWLVGSPAGGRRPLTAGLDIGVTTGTDSSRAAAHGFVAVSDADGGATAVEYAPMLAPIFMVVFAAVGFWPRDQQRL